MKRLILVLSVVMVMAISAAVVTAQEPPHREGGRQGNGLVRGIVAEIAEQAGVDTEAIRQQIEDGTTLSDVATAAGLDPAAIMAGVKENAIERLNERVSEGELTQEEADERLAELDEQLQEAMNAPISDLHEVGRQGIDARRAVVQAAAAALDLEPADLREQFSEGQTLADFITANGGDVDAISAAAVEIIETHLNEAVSDGDKTQEEVDALLADVDSAVEDALNSSFQPREGRERGGNRGQ